ncbi:MAG: hypothetical protein U0Z44_07400 [Kouleothrix sp.]
MSSKRLRQHPVAAGAIERGIERPFAGTGLGRASRLAVDCDLHSTVGRGATAEGDLARLRSAPVAGALSVGALSATAGAGTVVAAGATVAGASPALLSQSVSSSNNRMIATISLNQS